MKLGQPRNKQLVIHSMWAKCPLKNLKQCVFLGINSTTSAVGSATEGRCFYYVKRGCRGMHRLDLAFKLNNTSRSTREHSGLRLLSAGAPVLTLTLYHVALLVAGSIHFA
ncbi:hypothetical protein J6590_045161 [Homalodisca vitripennis]|nr:hypothetical protein J6590_045161 [Homalodisca vitripennis]